MVASKTRSRRTSAHKTTRRSRMSTRKLDTKQRERLGSRQFAFPKQRKEPLTDKRHVQTALARFDQVEGVSDSERRRAFERIKKAARKFGLDVQESNWRQLGKQPHTRNPVHAKRKSH